MSRTRVIVIVSIVAVIALAAIVAYAVAQPHPGGGPHGMMGHPPMPAQMAVSGNAVYIVQGPMIYKLDAKNLEVLAEAELPRPEPPEGHAPQQ